MDEQKVMDEQKKDFPVWVLWAILPVVILLIFEYMRDFK